MAKTLSFTDTSPQTVKIGDTTTSFTLVCGNDNVAVDLTNATSITVKLGNDSGYLKSATVDPASLTDPTTGQVTVTFSADLMTSLTAGDYQLEVWVVDSTGTSIYPSDGSTGFTITNNIQSTDGSTITTITFDDFVKELNAVASTITDTITGSTVSLPMLDDQLRSNFVSINDYTPQSSGTGGVNVSNGTVTGFGTQTYWSHAQYSVAGNLNLYVSFGKSSNTAVTAHIFATDDNNKILASFVPGAGDAENLDNYAITTPTGTTKLFVQSYSNYEISVSDETYQSLSKSIEESDTNLKQEIDDELKIYKEINNSNVYDFISRQGMLNGYPENSNEAVLHVKQNGFNHVRVSVAFTSDNVPVLIHDASINRVARNSDGSAISSTVNIADITLEQANTYDWGVAYGQSHKGMTIPLLSDFLKICSFKSILPTLEFKPSTATDDQLQSIINMVDKYGLADKTYFTSTVGAILLSVNKINPSINIGLIAQLNSNAKVDAALKFKTEFNDVRIDMFDTDTPSIDVINYASSKGVGIKVASAYSLADIVKFASMGVTKIEVAYVAFPATALNEYYDSL